jgi:metal-responsive CopG/Arc/MetJ family transcriptional regulator
VSRQRAKTPVVSVRLAREVLAALDKAAADGSASRAMTLRKIVLDYLRERGYLPEGA